MIQRNSAQILIEPRPSLNFAHMCTKEDSSQKKQFLYEVQPYNEDLLLIENEENKEE